MTVVILTYRIVTHDAMAKVIGLMLGRMETKMENPQTWTLAEHVVNRALEEHYSATRQKLCGLSIVRQITDALRAEGLLKDNEPV